MLLTNQYIFRNGIPYLYNGDVIDMNSPTNYSANNLITQEIANYIDYELEIFEQLTKRKFSYTVLENGKIQLHGYEEPSKERQTIVYPIIFRANNLNEFLEKLLMIREFLITKFNGNKSNE